MELTFFKNRNNQIGVLLSCLTGLAITLLIFRFYWSDSLTYWSLSWNLFLACVPLLISKTIRANEKRLTTVALIPAIGLWLLFFPNAPYILTDLFHLETRGGMPKWFDLLMVLTFAWTGLILGFASLMDIQQVVTNRYSRFTGWTISILSIIMGSFGIYLGRYLRWNSWDIVTSPESLVRDIYHIVINPVGHPRTVGMTLVFSAFLILVYMTFFFLKPEKESSY